MCSVNEVEEYSRVCVAREMRKVTRNGGGGGGGKECCSYEIFVLFARMPMEFL